MKKMFRNHVFALLTMVAVVVGAGRAEAVVLLVGDDNVAVPLTPFDGVTQLASIFHLTAPPIGGEWTGTLSSAVYRNAGGTLDFYYQISNTSIPPKDDTIVRSSHFAFDGFVTDVSAISTPGSLIPCTNCPGGFFMDGTEDPDLADRLADSTVGFDFFPDTEGVEPGEVSLVYVIRTNATKFTNGGSSMSDGGTDTKATFQPTIPEPGSLGLFAIGLLGSATVLRRRWVRKA